MASPFEGIDSPTVQIFGLVYPKGREGREGKGGGGKGREETVGASIPPQGDAIF